MKTLARLLYKGNKQNYQNCSLMFMQSFSLNSSVHAKCLEIVIALTRFCCTSFSLVVYLDCKADEFGLSISKFENRPTPDEIKVTQFINNSPTIFQNISKVKLLEAVLTGSICIADLAICQIVHLLFRVLQRTRDFTIIICNSYYLPI